MSVAQHDPPLAHERTVDMELILALIQRISGSPEVGTKIIVHWTDQVVAAWQTAVNLWWGLNGW